VPRGGLDALTPLGKEVDRQARRNECDVQATSANGSEAIQEGVASIYAFKCIDITRKKGNDQYHRTIAILAADSSFCEKGRLVFLRTRVSPMTDSEYALELLREGAEFTLYRGRERGSQIPKSLPHDWSGCRLGAADCRRDRFSAKGYPRSN